MRIQLLVIGMALLLLAVVSVTRADPKLHPYTPTAETTNEVQYDYRYAVEDLKSGVVNDRWEQRYGEYVKGAYSVLEPDGKVRTVDYEVDGPKGFHAVIRTQYPGNKLLSYIQLQKSLKQPHPLVNVLTNQKIETASSEFNNQRSARLHKNLPVNFHSISPNYYLSLVPGQRTNYRNRNLTTASGAFIAVAPDRQQIPSDQFMAHEHHDHNHDHSHDHNHDHNHELHNHHVQDDNAPGFPGQQRFEQTPRRIQGFAEPSQFMLPPPVGPSVYSQFTEAIPVPQASSTNFRRTYYSGG